MRPAAPAGIIGGRSYTSKNGGTVKVTATHDEDTDTYHLGAEIDGAFVSFASVPGSTVEGLKASAEAAKAADGGGGSSSGGGGSK